MKATEILMSEHRVIERVLTALERAATQLEAGENIRPEFFLNATDFIRGFADGCHHRKEEGVLFKQLGAAGLPMDSGPVGVMLVEHEHGRIYTRGLRAAAQRWQDGDTTAIAAIIANAHNYVSLLRDHIMKEDNILFPMADRVIPPAAYQKVEEGFENVEHEETGDGVHEKYLVLAESLVSAV